MGNKTVIEKYVQRQRETWAPSNLDTATAVSDRVWFPGESPWVVIHLRDRMGRAGGLAGNRHISKVERPPSAYKTAGRNVESKLGNGGCRRTAARVMFHWEVVRRTRSIMYGDEPFRRYEQTHVSRRPRVSPTIPFV